MLTFQESHSYVDLFSLRLAFNETSQRMGNAPGVEVKVPYFGTTKGVSYLDPSLYHPGEYFAEMVAALENIGFEENISLRAAPFDFRYAPSKYTDLCDCYLSILTYLMNQYSLTQFQ